MTEDFAARVALVTGAAQGMGRATAERLISRGASVAVNDLDPDRIGRVALELGERALALPGSVADSARVRAMVQETVDRFGRVDILVNNAGICYSNPFERISEEEWRRLIDVNLTGTFLCTQAVVVPMKAGRYGRIVNLSSVAGKNVSTVGGASYTASKAGVLGLTRATAKELAQYGITANAVCPGMIDTEMIRKAWTSEQLDAYLPSIPLHRLGSPHEVADLICFLASEQAGYITGAAFDITGGELMV